MKSKQIHTFLSNDVFLFFFSFKDSKKLSESTLKRWQSGDYVTKFQQGMKTDSANQKIY